MSERRFPYGDITIPPQGLYDVYSGGLVISINNNPETQVRALPPPPSIREGRAERESLGMLFNVHGKSERGVEYFKINFVFQSIINSLES